MPFRNKVPRLAAQLDGLQTTIVLDGRNQLTMHITIFT
jgi:hypothetical protein